MITKLISKYLCYFLNWSLQFNLNIKIKSIKNHIFLISFFLYLISTKRNIKNVQQFVNLSISSISNFIISIGIPFFKHILSCIYLKEQKCAIQTCFFLIRRICFSPYVRLLLVISYLGYCVTPENMCEISRTL